MGGGSWTSQSWGSYSSAKVSGRSAAQIYTASHVKPEYDPKNVTVRESCDGPDHPDSTPVIVGLDVTGSMGGILELVAKKLGTLVSEVYDRLPVPDPQILFAAVGDSTCDDAPLQVTQFESDIRIAEQLTDLWFEQGGGGNGFESYPLVWYFAANKTKIDSFDKHGKKGFIFTMGDDCYPISIPASHIKGIFGDIVEKDVDVKELLTQVNRKYEVFHLMLEEGGSASSIRPDRWKDLLGERAIKVIDHTKIPEIIVSILEAMAGKKVQDVVASWDGSTAIAVQTALNGLTSITQNSALVDFN